MRVTNTETFIARAKQKHGDLYDYTDTVYTNSKHKVSITCRVHGSFLQNPTNHYTRSGCPKCSGSGYIRNQQELLEEFRGVHGDTYDYSQVTYVKEHLHVRIRCPKHGYFNQAPRAHKSGQGCPSCGVDSRRIEQPEAINRFIAAHGEKFDYSKVKYTNKDSKVEIICPEHGSFYQRAADHWKGMGCQKCSLNGFKSDLPGFLYYLNINSGEAFKIGITNRSVQDRFCIADLKSIQVLKVWYFENGSKCREMEQRILKKYREYKYTGKPLLASGNTELFIKDIFEGNYNEIDTMGQ